MIPMQLCEVIRNNVDVSILGFVSGQSSVHIIVFSFL
jgi:hypothetical protein